MDYESRPERVVAAQWTGHNTAEIANATGYSVFVGFTKHGDHPWRSFGLGNQPSDDLWVRSPGGGVHLGVGDWVVKYESGAVAALTDEFFRQRYQSRGRAEK